MSWSSVVTWIWPPFRRRLWRPTEEQTRLGAILLDMGLITEAQLQHAVFHRAREEEILIGKVLVKLGFITEEDLGEALIAQAMLRNGKIVEGKTRIIERHFAKPTGPHPRSKSSTWLVAPS